MAETFRVSISPKRVSEFAETLKTVCLFSTHVNFICGNGLVLKTMDSAHVSLIETWFSPTFFDKQVGDKPVVFGVDIGLLLKIFKIVPPNSFVKLHYNEQTSKLTVQGDQFEYVLATMQIDEDTLEVPEEMVANMTVLDMDAEMFKIMNELAVHWRLAFNADTLSFEQEKEWLVMKTETDLCKARQNFKIEAPVTHLPRLTFNSKLYAIIKPRNWMKRTLSLGRNMPAVLMDEHETHRVRGFIAPIDE